MYHTLYNRIFLQYTLSIPGGRNSQSVLRRNMETFRKFKKTLDLT